MAGSQRGNLGPKKLIKELNLNTTLPVISAGGVSTKQELEKMLSYGAVGVSVGSPFIASFESGVSEEYKQACVDYGAKDIVLTEKISGTPCTVINTPYVKKVGTKQTWLEQTLNKNKTLKKWVKMIRYMIGSNAVTKAATEVTYKTVWVAGLTIENTTEISAVSKIVDKLFL